MNKQKINKEQRKEILLVAIYLFSQYGREEISHSELIDCLTEFQKKFPLGYEFSEKVPYYSQESFEDLDNLYLHKGYIKWYKYKPRDVPFPKNFIALWPLGRGHAKKIIETLSPEIFEALNKAVRTAIEKYKKT